MLSQMFLDAYDSPIGNGMLYLQTDERNPKLCYIILTKGWMIQNLQTEYMVETSTRELEPLTVPRAKKLYPVTSEAIRFGLELGMIKLSGKELSWLEENILSNSDPLVKLIKERHRKHKHKSQ